MVKIIGLVGSPRDGNTLILVKEALLAAKKLGCDTELVHLGRMKISSCSVCDGCRKENKCVIDDDFNQVADSVSKADGVIMGSPVYFGGMSAQLKSFVDRTRYLRRTNALVDKIGGAVTVGGARNGGQETAIQQIHNFFLIQGMIVAGDENTRHYGGTGHAQNKADSKTDVCGIETSRNLGTHVAKVAIKLKNKP
ncbi:MAG: flavodoxin family protein [Candidatus Aenigmarchaeota archaeon]|nr:flavodoxin family protein [Candidatus Aenigmarchaeota archaeon]